MAYRGWARIHSKDDCASDSLYDGEHVLGVLRTSLYVGQKSRDIQKDLGSISTKKEGIVSWKKEETEIPLHP